MNSLVIVPPQYRDNLLQHLAREVAGGRSLETICKEDEGVPEHKLVLAWMKRDLNWQEEIAQAVEVSIIDKTTKLYEIVENVEEDPAAIAKARLQVDTHMKMLKMMRDSGILKDDKVATDEDQKELRSVKQIIDERTSTLPPGAKEINGEIVDVEVL